MLLYSHFLFVNLSGLLTLQPPFFLALVEQQVFYFYLSKTGKQIIFSVVVPIPPIVFRLKQKKDRKLLLDHRELTILYAVTEMPPYLWSIEDTTQEQHGLKIIILPLCKFPHALMKRDKEKHIES